MTQLVSDFSWISDDDRKHAAWSAFEQHMCNRAFGREETLDAWHMFSAGWDARTTWEPCTRWES